MSHVHCRRCGSFGVTNCEPSCLDCSYCVAREKALADLRSYCNALVKTQQSIICEDDAKLADAERRLARIAEIVNPADELSMKPISLSEWDELRSLAAPSPEKETRT